MIILAQISEQIFRERVNAAQAIQGVFDDINQQLLTGPVFLASSRIAFVIALLGIGWFTLDQINRAQRYQEPFKIPKSLLLLLLAAFAIYNTGSGSYYGRFLLSATDFLRGVELSPVRALSTSSQSTVIDNAVVRSATILSADEGFRQCAEIPGAEERNACLGQLVASTSAILEPFAGDQPWANEVQAEVSGRASAAQDGGGFDLGQAATTLLNPAYATGRFFSGLLLGGAGGLQETVGVIVASFLFLLGSLFAYISGIIRSVLMVVAPIFVMLSIIPIYSGSFVGWGKAYLQVSVFNLMFNLMAAIAAWANTSTNSDPLLFPMAVALLSAAFSLSLLANGSNMIQTATRQAGSGAAGVIGVFRSRKR